MNTNFSFRRLRGTGSVLALSVAGLLGASAQSASAQTGIYGGGSTLVSLSLRQLLDCYNGVTLTGGSYSISSNFDQTAPTPGLLPGDCGSPSPNVIGLYAAVGSGSGTRAFIANDPNQLLQSNFHTPAVPPVYLESTLPNFSTYPYPRIDFGASDSPLPATLTTSPLTGFSPSNNWQNVSGVNASTGPVVTYDPTVKGPAIQLPLIEAPVAIIVNTDNTSGLWQIQSSGTPGTPGSAIQLSTAQLCAIFSGQVTDWSYGGQVAALDSSGQPRLAFFSDDNTGNGNSAQPYATGPLPIQVVFRSDGSGTSYIITNYLANSCPQLDTDGSLNYKQIFTGVGLTYSNTVVTYNDPAGLTAPTTAKISNGGAANLPSTTFANLIANINAVTGIDVSTGPNPWLGGSGSAAVAYGVNNAATNAAGVYLAGRIGYVSNDYSQPYNLAANGAPASASIQDEYQRSQGIYHPGDQGQNFIAPTPATADAAFQLLTAPTADPITGNYPTYAQWNVYAEVYPNGETFAGVNLTKKSRLGVPNQFNAYPIAGTTFAYLYSCYNSSADPTRVADITGFLNWLYTSSDATNVLLNNGFSPLDQSFATAIQAQYLTPGNGAAIADSSKQTDGCTGVALTGGAQ